MIFKKISNTLKMVLNAGNYSGSSNEKQHSGRKGIDLNPEPILAIVSMGMPYFQWTYNMGLKGGNVLLAPAVPCNKLLWTIYFSIISVPIR